MCRPCVCASRSDFTITVDIIGIMTKFHVPHELEKRCSKCGIGKATPYSVWCKLCRAAYMRDNRKTHSQLTDEQRQKANCRAYTKMLQRRGHAQKGPCEVCGDPDAQNHHDDYSKPREFRRLCRKHHRAADAAKTEKEPTGIMKVEGDGFAWDVRRR